MSSWTRPVYRTRKQVQANELDLQMHNIVVRIEQFASEHNEDDARRLAATINGYRHRIRKHMHPQDREGTQ